MWVDVGKLIAGQVPDKNGNVLPDGTPIGSNFTFYVRISCKKTSSGIQFINDVAGDNQVGPGTTSTSWNLQ
jgi:hypothetical protein